MRKVFFCILAVAISLLLSTCVSTSRALREKPVSCSNYDKLYELSGQDDANAMNTLAFCLLSLTDPPCKELSLSMPKPLATTKIISERLKLLASCVQNTKEEHVKTALLLLKRAAELGNSDAEYNFDRALSHFGGGVIGVNTNLGYEGSVKAAKKGHPYAQLHINAYRTHEKQSAAIVEKLAQEGFAEAELVMASALLDGNDFEQDPKRALQLYSRYKKHSQFNASPHAIYPALDTWSFSSRAIDKLRASESCEYYKKFPLPEKDKASSEERKRLEAELPINEESWYSVEFYFGANRPKDFEKARHVAFIEIEKDTGIYNRVGGINTLTMIYANGFGVPKNLDIALAFACRGAGSLSDSINSAVVNHLLDLKEGKQESSAPYDICEDAISRAEISVCSHIISKVAGAKQALLKEQLTKNWSEAAKAALKKLNKDAHDFLYNVKDYESDQGGRLSHVYAEEERRENEEAFVKLLQLISEGQLPKTSFKDFQAADKELNSIYRQVLLKIQKRDCRVINCMELPNQDGIRLTQKSWLRYRDTWVALARIQFLSVSPLAIKTLLTKQRKDMLLNVPCSK